MPDLLSIIRERTDPALHYLVEPNALLTDLGFNDDARDMLGLRDAVERAYVIEIPTAVMVKWRTVGDVAESVVWFVGEVA